MPEHNCPSSPLPCWPLNDLGPRTHHFLSASQLFSLSLPLLGSLYVDCRGSGGVETAGSDPAAPRGTGMLEGEVENFASQKDQI